MSTPFPPPDPLHHRVQLDLILEAAALGVFDFDSEHGTTVLTPHLQAWFGVERLDRQTVLQRVHPDDVPRVKAVMRQQLDGRDDLLGVELRVRPDPSAGWRWLQVHSRVIERSADGRARRAVGIARDITAERETRELREMLENGLREAQKVRLLAQLSGGVAHDLNNVLQVMQLACRSLEAEPLSDEGRVDVTRALEAVQRATRLTNQLLAAGRRQALELGAIDVDSLVAPFAQRHGVDFEGVGAPLVVRADRGQLEDCLLHLVRNAREAKPRSSRVVVRARAVVLNDEQVRLHTAASPGRWLRLDVIDDGEGMDVATVERACEPFFTTRKASQHPGLGLSVVNGVVQQHGGFVSIQSSPDAGTCVSLFLPSEATEAPAPLRLTRAVATPSRRHTARVLLADDDLAVRGVVETVLRSAGHQVLLAADGEAAVQRYLADPAAVDVCIFDVLMPRVDGVTATRLIRARYPLVPILLCTGFMGHATERVATGSRPTRLLRKPFTAARLLSTVDELLSVAATAPGRGG